MQKMILITGGAGFIGSRLARACLQDGIRVRILDNFSPQIHSTDQLPSDLADRVELFKGDIRDKALLGQALSEVDTVVHLAAETGTGQSMYEIQRYFDVNVQGTAVLLDLLQNDSCAAKVQSIVVASSRAIYGEGAYFCESHGNIFPDQRSADLMSKGLFNPVCPDCGGSVKMCPTTERAALKPMSFYGLTKQVQEEAILLYAKTKGISGYALRYQNVFGPGQSLKNPYTGILAVFSNLARQNHPIDVFEDGLESRDFVYIDDVVEATKRAVLSSSKFVGSINVGSGVATSVIEVANAIKQFFGSSSSVNISGRYRVGDIRHNIADTQRLQSVLNFKPNTDFSTGLNNFLTWAASQPAEDKAAYTRSLEELNARGLMGSAKQSS
jgi:dTDP-L-rhamnose 4-epimerase